MTAADREAPPKKPSLFRRLLWRAFVYCLVVLALAAIASALFAYMAYDYITRPGVPGTPVRVDVPEGASGKQIAGLLARHALIDHEIFFLAALRIDKTKRHIKSGRYDLPTGLSPLQLVHTLQEGPNGALAVDEIPPDRKVTIPEGLSITQMAALFDEPEAFIEAVHDAELIAKLGLPVSSLEGYLMPDTYFFDKPPTEREVVERMLDTFIKTRDALASEYPDFANADLHQIVTVASLIEEEARVDDERPLVAAVIYNRVDQGIPLCLDSTLQYALGKYGQRMLDRDKEVDSPYNTYKNAGLPPGPISSPGKASLRAALRPAEVEYLYFVSNADGKTHTFSETLADHNKAVATYRREIAIQRREQAERAQ